MRAVRILIPALLVAGCATSTPPDPGLEGLALTKVAPDTIIPGTKIVVTGASFVDDQWGATTLHLVGQAGGQDVDVEWPARFVDFGALSVAVTGGYLDELGGDVDFEGTATVDVVATSDGNTYSTAPLDVTLRFRNHLTPSATGVDRRRPLRQRSDRGRRRWLLARRRRGGHDRSRLGLFSARRRRGVRARGDA